MENDSPVVPYTGLDAAMAHDNRMLGEIDAQIARGVPVGEARASAPLRMPEQFDGIYDAVNKMKAGRAAAEFSDETLRNLDLVYEELETAPPAGAVVVNFHPLTLRVNGGRNYYQSVPPCTPDFCLKEPGRQCTSMMITEAAIDPVPQESGNHTFNKIFPIWMAQNYMNVANSNEELWGHGAFVYEGELTPEEMWEENPFIKTFTHLGMPLTTETNELVKSRRAGGLVNGKKRVPIVRPYRDVYMEMFERRNQSYFNIVKRVDSEYHQLDPAKRKNAGINGMTRDQAQVCLNLGLLLKPPIWLTPTRLDAGVAAEKCSNCGADVLTKAVMCGHCNWPVDPYQAFMESKIDVEHLALLDLPEEKLTEVYKVDYERKDKVKKARQNAGDQRRKDGQDAARKQTS